MIDFTKLAYRKGGGGKHTYLPYGQWSRKCYLLSASDKTAMTHLMLDEMKWMVVIVIASYVSYRHLSVIASVAGIILAICLIVYYKHKRIVLLKSYEPTDYKRLPLKQYFEFLATKLAWSDFRELFIASFVAGCSGAIGVYVQLNSEVLIWKVLSFAIVVMAAIMVVFLLYLSCLKKFYLN